MIRRKPRPGKRYVSIFRKNALAFIFIGIIPMLLMGFSIYSSYSGTIQQTLLSNLSQMTVYVGRNISDICREMDETTKFLYNYGITDYDYFYELVLDEEISETKREAMITDVLRSILYTNQKISQVFFITPDGRCYSCMRPPEIHINQGAMKNFHDKYYDPANREGMLIPSHINDYYYYQSDMFFSAGRNIMNTKSLQTARNEVLGTIYLDVPVKWLEEAVQEADFAEGDSVSVIDAKQMLYVYDGEETNIRYEAEEFRDYIPLMTGETAYIRTDDSYLIYSLIPGTDWIIVDRVTAAHIESEFREIRNRTLFLIIVSAFLLGMIYLFYNRKTSLPITGMREAMARIQNGDLDARVEIHTNDELGIIAEGLNQMTAKLQDHIGQVYIAQIKQRDAELEALKTQIQPHYLYNTLDVIRMTAVTNDDPVTAEMLDSLSGQLKYLIGTNRDLVPLKAEIDSIRNYFRLIKIRFDNRFELEVDIADELMGFQVPHLIIQPIVENSVKHGLRPKTGAGRIAIYVKKKEDSLEVVVMDNGVGMSEEQVESIRKLLTSDQPGKRNHANWESIGIKNVYDRIRLLFGPAYGFEISSYEGIGTIVKYRLPVILEGGAPKEQK